MKKALLLLFLFIVPAGASEIECVSLGITSGTVGERTNYKPRISTDGRFVVFESRDQLIPPSRNRFRDIFIFDRNKQTSKKIEPPIERANSGPSISGGGRYIVYQSYPLSVVLGESPVTADIYIYDRYLNKSSIQNFGLETEQLDGEDRDASFSSDGRYLVFTSNGAVYPGLKNGLTRQVYLFDHEARTLELISRPSPSLASAEWLGQGDPGNRQSVDPRVSRNARFVAFKSASTNLIRLLPLDSLATHLYLLDRRQRILIQVDEQSRGFNSDHSTIGRYDMDDNGGVLVFEGRARNLTKPMEVLFKTDLYIFNRSSGAVSLLTTGLFSEKSHSPTLSGDGRFLAFVFRGIFKGEIVEDGLIVYDIKLDRWVKVVNGSLANPDFSRNGQYITFESNQIELVPGVKTKHLNIYIVKNPYYE